MPNKIKILMVEDSKDLLAANRKLLESDDCEIYSAVNLAQARAILKTDMPDLAILDIILPDGDGLEFAAELRQISSAVIIFLTNKTRKSDKAAGYIGGAVQYIPKPYNPEEFTLIVRNVMTDIMRIRSPRRTSSSLLTAEERDAARLVVAGESNKNIANALCIAEVSVRKRLKNAYKKLNIKGEDREKRKRLAEVIKDFL